jgi:5-methylcytosine-specific restriction endonuclease McrA
MNKQQKLRAKIRRAKWIKKNKAKNDATLLAYKLKHLAEIRAWKAKYNKTYYKKNKAYYSSARRKRWEKKYKAKNRVRIKTNRARYHVENKERCNSLARIWKLNNADKCVASNKKRAQQIKDNSTPRQIRAANKKIAEWLMFADLYCHYCLDTLTPSEVRIDHILALNRGGAHSPENICVACAKCNSSKRDSILGVEWIAPMNKPL